MPGLDPGIHLFKDDGLPGLAAMRRPGNDDGIADKRFLAAYAASALSTAAAT